MGDLVKLSSSRRECDDCGAHASVRRIETQTFMYGAGKDAIEIVAEVPVWRCDSCGSAYYEADGEQARYDAVCRHLGRMAPNEIREKRGAMSRKDLCTLTGIGEASIQRWEAGEVLQNAALDMLVRLVLDPVASIRMREIKRSIDLQMANGDGKFRTSFSQEQINGKLMFSLRRS